MLTDTRVPTRESPAAVLRRYRPSDRPSVAAMSDALSRETLFQRFHVGYSALPTAYLDLVDRCVEGPSAVLLVEQDGVVLGIGELVVTASRPFEGELGLMVRDSHRRRGIGLRLTRALVSHAWASGAHAVRAEVLTENRAVRSLIRTRYPSASAVLNGATVTYLLAAGGLSLPACL